MKPLNRVYADGYWAVDSMARPAFATPALVACGPNAAEGGTVAILLCTYRGQRYLAEQLDSYSTQTYGNWQVWASDDGSDDDTALILSAYQRKWSHGRISIVSGPRKGFVANFRSLTCRGEIHADYYAYSDQDDVWESDKLERAVRWLATIPEGAPALYCARTRLVDAENKEIGMSPLFSRAPGFANALMQNIGGGNTMVFNNAAREVLRDTGEGIPVVMHDWWTYLLISGCGGRVLYDRHPSLRYRQHNGNMVGMNSTWDARMRRIHMAWQGRFRSWNECNLAALRSMQGRLTPENREILERFEDARRRRLVPRLAQLKRSGVYRQTLLGNLGFVAAAVFNKI